MRSLLVLFALVAAWAALAPASAAAADRPAITRLRLAANLPTEPVVSALVNPGGATTTWHVEYGHTTAFGSVTPDVELAAGTEFVPVSATLTGLEPRRRVYWRVVATNEAGTRRSRRATFVTERAPSGVTLAVTPVVAPWGAHVVAGGQVLGTATAGITVALQRQPFPYSGPFTDVGTASADAAGAFGFDAGPLLVTTRFVVQTRSPVPAQSAVVTAYSAVLVSIATGPPAPRRVVLRGAVRPPVPQGRAYLQRQRADGRWINVQNGRLADVFTSSRYRFEVGRLRRAQILRVAVVPGDNGAHVPGFSGTVRLRARR